MFTNNSKCPDVSYLEDELYHLREDQRRREEEQENQRLARRKEREEQWYYEYRQADTWPEALEKQAGLFATEAGQWFDGEGEYPDTFFGPGAEACNRALEIWKEIEAAKQEKIEALQKQLRAVQDEIRLEVAAKLASEDKRQGWRSVVGAIEQDTDLSSWLQW